MAISKRLRYEVMKRDNHQCRYCGAVAPEAKLAVDHVVPVALGGSDEPSNLVTACVDCNAGKASSSPSDAVVDDVAQDAVRWRMAMEKAAAEARAINYATDEDLDLFYDGWTRGWMPDDWPTSVRTWLELGLTMEDLLRLQGKTFSRSRDAYWRYFCGAAWGTLRQRQERARQLMEGE